MVAFTPARPVGCRACGKRAISFEPLKECEAELRALVRNELDPELTRAAVKVLAARVWELIMSVRTGDVEFGGKVPGGRVIERHDCIYELRPQQGKGMVVVRDLRLYCGEPALQEGIALGLHLATKPHGQQDKAGEQNRAIDEAVTRAGRWELALRRSMMHDSMS